MLKIGDSVILSGEGKDTKVKIDKIDEKATFFTIIAGANTLRKGKSYNLNKVQDDGTIVGVVFVQDIVKPKSDAPPGSLQYNISVISPLKKQQKREYYRHDCDIQVNFNQVNALDIYIARMMNISARGAKIVTNDPIKFNSMIDCCFKLGSTAMHIVALVLEVINLSKDTSIYSHAARLKFVQISKKDEESIVKYIFEEFRKHRQLLK